MKTFLENLKKELEKRNFSKKDIEEILGDHEEMIDTAKRDGLSDEELEKKFGAPDKLAEDLLESKSNIQEVESIKVNGYTLLKTFPVIEKKFNVDISLESDDLNYLVHDEDQIEIYYKNIDDIDDYSVKFDGKELLMDYKKTYRINFSRKSGQFIVKVPEGIVSEKVNVHTISGEIFMDAIQTDEFNVKTTSGDVAVKTFEANKAKFRTVSGDLEFSSGTLTSLYLSMISGDTSLEDIKINGDIVCNTVSGDAKLTKVEADLFTFKTVSGDCNGIEFYPNNVSLKSVSGDINIENKDTAREIKVVHKKALSGHIKIN